MDLVVRCAHLPLRGETIIANEASEIPGGKGANQAVAAARAGGEVTMVGRVGDDGFSNQLLENLTNEEIDTEFVRKTPNCASGIAVVAVEESGENNIMVIPGANARITPGDVANCEAQIARADVLLLQLEIPIESVAVAAEIARKSSVPIILDPAPMNTVIQSQNDSIGLLNVDVMCPNQSEAAQIVGHPVETIDDARHAARKIHDLGVQNVVITLGKQGAVEATENGDSWIDSFPVKAIDTTAAGDAFAGALAVQWAGHRQNAGRTSVHDAIRYACAAGAIAATRVGAQPSMATTSEIQRIMNGDVIDSGE